jgi:hypothetical protein
MMDIADLCFGPLPRPVSVLKRVTIFSISSIALSVLENRVFWGKFEFLWDLRKEVLRFEKVLVK